jgi:hypothetical protein
MARRALDMVDKSGLASIDVTAMRTLLAAASQAGSAEEIEIIVRYQQARFRDRWDGAFIDQLLAVLKEVGDAAKTDAATDDKDSAAAKAIADQLGLIARVHRFAIEKKRAKNDRDANRDRPRGNR